jgi:hypothetical protein
MPRRENIKQRISGSRAKRVWTLPNRWSSESHQACLNGRVVTEVGVANGSCFDQRSNIVLGRAKRQSRAKREKIMTDLLAFGEPTHARPIASKLSWHSLNRGLGHSSTSERLRVGASAGMVTKSITNIFATLHNFFLNTKQKSHFFFVLLQQIR